MMNAKARDFSLTAVAVLMLGGLLQLAQQSRDPALMAAAEEISRLAAGLRDTTMRIRMVPVRSMIGRFRRLIRPRHAPL